MIGIIGMNGGFVIALVTVAGLLAGVFSGNVHMAGGMLVHQVSVLIVIANGMRLLRVPVAPKVAAADDAGSGSVADQPKAVSLPLKEARDAGRW